MTHSLPYRLLAKAISVSTILSLAAIVLSVSVAYAVTGNPFGTVSIPALRNYGITGDDIEHLQLWRLITAQLIHAKQEHMLLNALSLLLLAGMVQRRIGGMMTAVIWLVAGGVATLASTLTVAPPWNIGTGASQATFAFAGCASLLLHRAALGRWTASALIALVVIPGLALDFASKGYPQPGHVVGFILGAIAGGFCSLRRSERSAPLA